MVLFNQNPKLAYVHFVGEARKNLKAHAILVHNFKGAALRSQTNQNHQDHSITAKGTRQINRRMYKKDTAQSLGALRVL